MHKNNVTIYMYVDRRRTMQKSFWVPLHENWFDDAGLPLEMDHKIKIMLQRL